MIFQFKGCVAICYLLTVDGDNSTNGMSDITKVTYTSVSTEEPKAVSLSTNHYIM